MSIDRFLDKVFLKDVFDLLKDLPDRSVDMVYGDPDYNVGVKYGDKSYTKTLAMFPLTHVTNCAILKL